MTFLLRTHCPTSGMKQNNGKRRRDKYKGKKEQNIIHPSVRPSIHPITTHTYIHRSLQTSFPHSLHLSVHPGVQPSNHPTVHLAINPSIYALSPFWKNSASATLFCAEPSTPPASISCDLQCVVRPIIRCNLHRLQCVVDPLFHATCSVL